MFRIISRLTSALFLGALISVLSTSAFAAWKLDPADSSLHFISVKNDSIAEVHQFDMLSGQVDGNALTVTVPLTSVNTNIPIRNERMQTMLFNVAEFASATFSADLPDSATALKPGETATMDVMGKLTLAGQSVETTFSVRASRLTSSSLSVSTVKPTVLQAKAFGLSGGIEALKTIAGLREISPAVPVTFDVTFVLN